MMKTWTMNQGLLALANFDFVPLFPSNLTPIIHFSTCLLCFISPKTTRHLLPTAYPARAPRALGLLLADGAPIVGGGEDFLTGKPDFFTETAVTPERKVEKSFPRWEINRHVEG